MKPKHSVGKKQGLNLKYQDKKKNGISAYHLHYLCDSRWLQTNSLFLLVTHDPMILRTNIVYTMSWGKFWPQICMKNVLEHFPSNLKLSFFLGWTSTTRNHLQRLFVWKRVPNQCIPENGASPTARVVSFPTFPISIHHRGRSSTKTASK